ncbi:MAG: hypothetical protein RBU30_17880 [Polyangia bacterium]|jgi:beta propeller repeat protein|nr:hypothetical protein [Polyangia bacterium]
MKTTCENPCAVALAALLVLLIAACGDNGPPGSPDSGVDAQPDAWIRDAEPDVVDARVWPDARPDTGWCGENPFPGVEPNAIPLTADLPMWINGLSRDGTVIVYAHWHSDTEHQADVFLFDTLIWVENRITNSADSSQVSPSIRGAELVWSDSKYSIDSGEYWHELVHYNISTGIETRLTNSTDSRSGSKFNGRYVVYDYTPDGIYTPDLRLLDIETHEDILLCDRDWKPVDVSISDRYVTWVAIPPGRPDWNRDVFIYDIEAGETLQLDTPTTYQYVTSVHGSRVVWMDSRNGQWDIYLYDIETGDETRLTDDPFDQTTPWIYGNLVTFSEYRFTLGWDDGDHCARDIQIMDLETGVTRRVTSLPWFWYAIPGEGGLLLAKLFEDPSVSNKSKLYMFDLIAMGILDPTGQHVLPAP